MSQSLWWWGRGHAPRWAGKPWFPCRWWGKAMESRRLSTAGWPLSVWACLPLLGSVASARKVEKTFHSRPTSCLLCALCDHRWSGLRPRESFRPEALEVLPPIQQGVVPENEMSRIRDPLPLLKNLHFEASSPQAEFAQRAAKESVCNSET